MQLSGTLLTVQITWGQSNHNTEAFVDSGAVECFMDIQWAREWGVPLYPLEQPCYVAVLDGRPLGTGVVDTITAPLSMHVAPGEHTEHITFFFY